MDIIELKNRFTDVKKIKKGGQKIVYKATYDDKTIALKIISDASDPRVLQEIDVVKNIKINNIPNIIESGKAYDASINEYVLYIIEEYIEGISLRDWLNSGNRFNLSMAYGVLSTLIDIEVELEIRGNFIEILTRIILF
ncbi:hypothetical protein [uncultured Ruminococcus sp.]|uniref:hypothetical protein n=1 Tax=uncultured Ruminococcus sp. TaxID=165186 RepID=UPI00259A9B7B|nr:hypothetical protein [uncultured Ruminococcus sp.]